MRTDPPAVRVGEGQRRRLIRSAEHPSLFSARVHHIAYSTRGDAWVLVFPDPDGQPPRFGEPAIGVAIPLPGGFHLRGPESGISHCHGVVIRTAVPETAVKEYRHLRPREDEVSGAPDFLDRSDRNAVAQTQSMHGGSQRDLWLGVSSPI